MFDLKKQAEIKAMIENVRKEAAETALLDHP